MQKNIKLKKYNNWRIWLGLSGFIATVAIFFVLTPDYPRLAIFWIFGLAFGFVLQRTQFCFVSGFSNFYIFRYGHMLKGILAGLAIATIGFTIIMFLSVPDPSSGNIPATAHVAPLGWHLVLAGIIFGVGMILAGSCIAGTLYRIGEGAVKALISLLGILIGMSFLLHTWSWWWSNYISQLPRVWLPQHIGWLGAISLTLASLGLLYLIIHLLEKRNNPRDNLAIKIKEGKGVTGIRVRLINVLKSIFKPYWPIMLGGVILAMINVIEYWIAGRPWGITGEISSWSTGMLNFMSLSPPQVIVVPGT